MTSPLPFSDWLPQPAQRLWNKHVGWRGAAQQAGTSGQPAVPSGVTPASVGIAYLTDKRVTPGEVFTPTQPRAGRRALVGRSAELERVLSALTDEAAHVVLYAERGRGKTSLTNLVVASLRNSGATIGRTVCHAESDFNQIMHGLVADLPASLLGAEAASDRATGAEGCAALLPGAEVRPADVASIPARLACRRVIFVVDEFDRVKDDATRTKLADTIKLLSDRSINLLFLVVGVSDTLDRIIGQHPSIQRNIVSVHLKLLEDAEIRTMLVRGGRTAGIVFTEAAGDVVVRVARGMPYMAQLMGLRITQETLRRGGDETSTADVRGAVSRLIEEDLAEAGARYAAMLGAAAGPLESAMHMILKAPQDKWGRYVGACLTHTMRAALLRSNIYEASSSLPGMLLPLDRPVIYVLLLQDALEGLQATQPGRVAAGREKDTVHGD